MMDDFQFLYGNDKKMQYTSNMARIVFDSTCKGYWSALTDEPHIEDGTGEDVTYYIVNEAGVVDLGSGDIEFEIDDIVKYDESTFKWYKTS